VKVLVDSSIWSLRLRRATSDDPRAAQLSRLIVEDRVEIIGPVRQEVLSGVRHEEQFLKLRNVLRAFVDRPLDIAHYETAATYANTCRAAGVQGSPIDFLICAVSVLDRLAIYTADADFNHFGKHLPIKRFQPI
jgi:predicted nucleic acid-binding protein